MKLYYQSGLTTKKMVSFFGFIFLGLLIWNFFSLFIYILIAAVLSMLCRPLLIRLDRITIKGKPFPHTLSTLISLAVMLFIFSTIFGLIVPLVAQQASAVGSIDMGAVRDYFQGPLSEVHGFMRKAGFMSSNEHLVDMAIAQLKAVIDIKDFSSIFGGILSTTGSIFMGAFSILFFLFFFLKESHETDVPIPVDPLSPKQNNSKFVQKLTSLLHKLKCKLLHRDPEAPRTPRFEIHGLMSEWILLLVPEKSHKRTKDALNKVKILMSRYFIGLLTEVGSMMAIESTLLAILGIENALLIGFLGGLLNVIPYLGPVMGAIVGVLITLIGLLSSGVFVGVGAAVLTVALVFLIANLIDNAVLQPLIYGKSVKAHPLEIFVVIIMAGSLAGIPGMISAIPVYTVLRIFAKEFLSDFRVIKTLTEKI